MDEVSQTIGHLQGRMDSHEAQLERIDRKLDDQGEKMDRLLEAFAHQRGARKATAVVVTGAGSVAGAMIGWFVTWIAGRP